MEDQQPESREEEFLREPFRTNAFLLIFKMVNLYTQVQQEAQRDANALVDEILHSIFFYGKILMPSFSPEDILGDDEMLNELKSRFPEPFELYSSQLPRRSPFSCVLDMIVLLLGRQNETVIIDGLRNLINELELGGSQDLVPAVICVSNRTDYKDQVKHYGVSMVAPPRYSRKSMIAASCFSSWDEYVAGAVMTYFPNTEMNPDFNGTITLPLYVRCQAFNLKNGNVKPPCRSCGNMFGLETVANNVNIYGNCAEVESLSNLFKNEVDVKEQARPTFVMYDEMREIVENELMTQLNEWLTNQRFTWRGDFYSPQ